MAEEAPKKQSAAEVLKKFEENKCWAKPATNLAKDDQEYIAEILKYGAGNGLSLLRVACDLEDNNRFKKLLQNTRVLCWCCKKHHHLINFIYPPCASPDTADLVSHAMCQDCWKRLIEELQRDQQLRCGQCRRDLFDFFNMRANLLGREFWHYHSKRLGWQAEMDFPDFSPSVSDEE